jgi:hypothetical protein
LREALETSAERVDVDPAALSMIRARTQRRAWWHRIRGGAMPLIFTTGAATAVVATITSVVLTAGSCTPTEPVPPATSPSVNGSASPAPQQSPSAATSSKPPAGTTANLPVYYQGLVSQGNVRNKPMLYREFHRLPAGDGGKAARVRAAVTEMLDGRTAYDKDYISSWPASAKVRDIQVEGTTVTVDLSGAAVNGYDPPSEAAALQQLIWTATAAADADGMKLLLDGKPVAKLWNLLPTSGTLRRGPAVDVLAPVWIIDPQQNAVVAKGPVTINAAGIVFEAHMRVRIRNASGAIVVDEGIDLSNGAPSQGTGTLRTKSLAPGTYTVEGFYYSLMDSSIQGMDSHTFTVR